MITRKTSRMAISSLSENVKIKIHQHGSVYAPKTLLNNTFNEEYNPDYFVTYIENKYLGVLNPRLFAQRHILILLHHFFIFFCVNIQFIMRLIVFIHLSFSFFL